MRVLLPALLFLAAAGASSAALWQLKPHRPASALSGTIVSLNSDTADPSVVFVKIGEKITFAAADGQPHEIAQGEGDDVGQNHDHTAGGVESGTIGPDEAWVATFSKPGSYAFHDHDHPKATVTVVAYDPGAKP